MRLSDLLREAVEAELGPDPAHKKERALRPAKRTKTQTPQDLALKAVAAATKKLQTPETSKRLGIGKAAPNGGQ